VRRRGQLFALLLAAAAVSAAGAGRKVDLCSSGSNFAGEILVGGFAPGTVRLEWTVFEDGVIRSYRLSRYSADCDRPERCGVRIAKLNASREPATTRTYTLIDTAPAGAWTYRLEILRSPGGPCSLESTVVVPSPPPCDTAALCAQVEESFAGDVLLGAAAPGTVELSWLTHAETAAVEGYRLSRYNCRVPRACTSELATVDATGNCGQVMLHSVTDTPPAGAWTYVLDVLDSGGRTACTMRLPAPASPASSR
jgi:hypothetical protein